MSRNWKICLFGLLAAGTLARIVLAFATYGSEYDQASFAFIREALSSGALDAYAARDEFGAPRWPYPPAFFPWIPLSGGLEEATGAVFHGLIALPAIAADAALAWIVQSFLGRRGMGPRPRLVAAALIALGPSFALISGYHNHFDSLAILPAVLALIAWEGRKEGEGGALRAGLLIGVGCALKTVPIVMLLALLPTARSRREGMTLTAGALAVPAVLIAPFLLSAPGATLESLDYSGLPGAGGLSLAIQPNLALAVVSDGATAFSRLSETLILNSSLLNLGALALVAGFLFRCRTPPLLAAALVWLTIYVFGTGFFFQYLVWGLPFFLMAGWLAGSAVIQVVALMPALMFYAAPLDGWLPPRIYALLMVGLWGGLALALGLLARREWLESQDQGRAWLGWSRRAPWLTEHSTTASEPRSTLGARALAGVGLLLAAWIVVPLAGLLTGGTDGTVFTGATGPFAGDQLQYMAWIREGADHLFVSNLFSLEESGNVFLHPMFSVSSLLVALGASIQLSVLIWAPIAAAVLVWGCGSYANRFASGPRAALAIVVLAIFFAAPFVAAMDLAGVEGSRYDELARSTGEMLSGIQLWGYLPTAISIGLMPLFLLWLERAATARRDGHISAVRRYSALAALAGLICAWLHPWQGETLFVVTVGLALWGGDFRRRDLVVPAAATLTPLLYYFALSRLDPAWELAQTANEALPPAGWAVLLAIAPLALPAALCWGKASRDLGERALRLWPLAALLVLFLLSPSVPAHVLGGLSVPLAVLAVRGWQRLRVPGWAAPVAVALVTLPGAAWAAGDLNDLIDAEVQPHRLTAGEEDALEYLRNEPETGGVLTTPYLGSAVPAFTGRQVWNGHPSWTPDFLERSARAQSLFEGEFEQDEASALIAETGARFLLSDCRDSGDLVASLEPQIEESREFGCAAVYEVEAP